MSTKRKLLLLLIIWVILTFIIGLVSYFFYPSWLAAAPLLAIIAAAAALAILDQLGGAVGLIDRLFPTPDQSNHEQGTNKNELQNKVHTHDNKVDIIGDGVHIEGGIHFHTSSTSSEQTNQQLSPVIQSHISTDQTEASLTTEDVSAIDQQARAIQEKIIMFQGSFSLRPEIILAFEELSNEIMQSVILINQYLQENPTHFLKLVLQSNIEMILSQCETVRQEIGQALLQANKDSFGYFTKDSKDALGNLGKNWEKFIINLERGNLSSGYKLSDE